MQHTHRFSAAGLPLALVLAGAGALAADSLTTNYDEGRSYEVSVRTSSSTETEFEMLVNGEAREDRGPRGGSSETSFQCDYTDTVVASSDGAPTKVRRAFGEGSSSASLPGREGPLELELESALDGVTLLLTLEDGTVEATVEDGDVDEDYRLEGHGLGLMLDALLPDGDVEVEGTWEIEPDALRSALAVGLSGRVLERPDFDGGEGWDEGGRPRRAPRGLGDTTGRLFGEDYEWTIEATLTDRTEECAGVQCRVITIEAEMSGDLPERSFGRGRGGRGGGMAGVPAAVPAGTIEAELEGELLWDPTTNHPARLHMAGTVESESSMSRDTERGSFESNTTRSTELETTIEVRVAGSDD